MNLRLIGSDQLLVLSGEDPLDGLFDSIDDFTAAALRRGDRWLLLQRSDLLGIEQEVKAGVDLDDLLGEHPHTLTVTLGSRPPRPAIVLDAIGDVSGAWVIGGAEAASEAEEAEEAPLRRRPSARRTVSGGGGGGGGDRDGGGESAFAEEPQAEPPDEDGGGHTIKRTPHLDAPERIAKAPGTKFPVTVYTDTKQLREGESGKGLEIELPPEIDSVDVGVLLQLSGHFEVSGVSEFGTLTIERGKDTSAALEFELQVVDKPPAGRAAISALFTLRGRSCGQVGRTWEWGAEGPEAPQAASDADAPVSMPLHVGAEPASLSIFITAPLNDGVHYQCAVEAPALEGYTKASKSEKFAVPAEGYEFMSSLLAALTAEDKTPQQRFRALREVGQEAWEATPGLVKEVLWKMVDAGVPPATIHIASVEPILPWELMIPRRFDGKAPKRLGPLGVEFAIGRWTRGDGQSPPPTLPVKSSFVVAPTYGAQRELAFEDELKLIEKHLRGSRVTPATVEDLDRRFAGEHASLLHFVCHGGAGIENDDVIALDHDEPLRAREMETLDGFEDLCEAEHPLVFLNACSTAQAVPSLAGGAGFPRSFGNIGAHAIVAPLWPVDDGLARDIAVELYTKALEPGAPPIASLLRDIRKRGYESENVDTYAAYCFFGDPLARLELI